jgi:hypothetical protein
LHSLPASKTAEQSTTPKKVALKWQTLRKREWLRALLDQALFWL